MLLMQELPKNPINIDQLLSWNVALRKPHDQLGRGRRTLTINNIPAAVFKKNYRTGMDVLHPGEADSLVVTK
jgi:hypothetical protein